MRKVTHRSPFGLLIQDPASRLIAAEAVPKVKALSTVVMATRMFVRECRFAGMMIGTRAVAGQRERGTVRFLGSFRLRAWLARQAEDRDIAILAELSRKCAVDAVVEGLRLGEDSKQR